MDVTGDVRVEAGSGVNKRHRKDLHIIYAPESRIYFFIYFTVFSAAEYLLYYNMVIMCYNSGSDTFSFSGCNIFKPSFFLFVSIFKANYF